MFGIGQTVMISLPGGQPFAAMVRGAGNNEYYVETTGFAGWVPATSVGAYGAPAYQPPPVLPGITGILPGLIPPIVQPYLPGYHGHPPYDPHRPPWGR
jgi:hypothetical protein